MSGLAGMDLVRRVLEEARGAARTQGKDVGRGRRLPPTRRVAGSGCRRRWSGPGPDARDPQPLGGAARDAGEEAGLVAARRRGRGVRPVADGGRRRHRRARDADRAARRRAERGGGIDGLGHPAADDPGAGTGQNRRRGRRRRGDELEDHRPGGSVVAKGPPAHRRTRARATPTDEPTQRSAEGRHNAANCLVKRQDAAQSEKFRTRRR